MARWDRAKWRLVILIAVLGMLGWAALKRATQVDSAGQDAASRAVLIAGVPFVSWHEAAKADYEGKEILNPSVPAAMQMVVRYWAEPEDWSFDLLTHGWANIDSSGAGTMVSLKQHLDHGRPVIVMTAWTPMGHPLEGGVLTMFGAGWAPSGLSVDEKGSSSRTLGVMVPLEALRVISDSSNFNPVRESLVMSARVVIGYDDARKVIVLHDPSFGPAMEWTYADFEQVWAATDHAWMVRAPSRADLRTARSTPTGYRARTANELAAEHFVFGNACSAAGRLKEGERHLRAGLALPGISSGYRFLLLYELALNQGERRRFDESVRTAEEATTVLPEYPGPWEFLASMYPQSSVPDARRKAENATKEARRVSESKQDMAVVARTIPSDFWVSSLRGIRELSGEP